jgi:2-amino-4-hydroxy-6-hydroxymethyldihydropteridine diphosphokinase
VSAAGHRAPPPGEPVDVVLALGTNVGDREEHLRRAVRALAAAPGLTVRAVSPVYETAPVGGPEQGRFLNLVLLAAAMLEPEPLLDLAQSVERELGRVRTVRWGPRSIDVDVIAYADRVQEEERLTLPHPRAHERAFVLRPWADVDPRAELAGRGRVADLLAEVREQDAHRRGDIEVGVPGGR